jgi:hypothetical protein
MKRTLSYLEPTKLYDNNQLREAQALSDVCVLMPSYKGPNQNSRYCIDTLANCGATIVASYGVSDVALHRCIVAAKAVTLLEHLPMHYVIWLDDDMSFTPAHVACLRDYVARYDVAISGMYCRRGNPFVIAASKLDVFRRDIEIAFFNRVMDSVLNKSHELNDMIPMFPTTGGLGCLMMKSEQFLRHCKAMPSARYAMKPGGGLEFIPEICSSGLREYGADGRWVSEDEAYCLSLWQHGIGVFTVPVPFGHYSHVPLVPTADALFLGEKRDV